MVNDDRKDTEKETMICESGPSILKEVTWVLRNSKTGKAAGPDEVNLEMILALGEGIDIL